MSAIRVEIRLEGVQGSVVYSVRFGADLTAAEVVHHYHLELFELQQSLFPGAIDGVRKLTGRPIDLRRLLAVSCPYRDDLAMRMAYEFLPD